ncbi:fish-egg lectin isoform X2 [Labeo rohita]|uniref:fish-egg lectin isoform X2 n=2 Tax=Labeo rohita TaxID=84645 RepID=UPI0021E2E2E9|nr:fish-egg lectin isoform X2 [Labeo rohita]
MYSASCFILHESILYKYDLENKLENVVVVAYNKLYRGAMKVYQSILLLFCCQFLHTLAFDCTTVSGNLKQIDAGSGSVVGVNNKNEAFVLIDNVFTKISTSLTHFSVGPAGQLGVDSANKILKLKGGSFVEFPGILKQVDAGGDQILAGVSRGAVPYCSKMDTNNNWPWRTHISPWVKLSGSLKYYSCGLYSCWGVNSNDQIYIRKDVSNKACSGSGTSENIPGFLAMIEVATDGSVFGVNSKGALYRRIGVTRSNPAGTDWQQMTACPNCHKHVSFDLGVLWAVCVDGSIRKCTF